MSYVGHQIPIPLGQLGLKTDDPQTSLPPNCAITANNIRLYPSRVEKSFGTAKFNLNALTASIVSVFDWWPVATSQRLIALTSDGKCWRDTGTGSFNTNTPIATGLGALTPSAAMAAGGLESAGNSRKLFIFTGTSQVQVLTGDGTSLAPIANPAADWASSYPTYGFVAQGRLCAFGNANSPHTFYISRLASHEDFTTQPSGDTAVLINVFPGEGDGLYSGIFYKGGLFLFKKPFGVYLVDTTVSADPAMWTVSKLNDFFGIASPHAVTQMMDDLVAGNNSGSITSYQATQAFGDVKAGDILTNAQVENYIKEQVDSSGIGFMHAIYHQDKKTAYFSGRTGGASQQNVMIVVDIARQTPRITLETKDQPTCLGLRRDTNNIPQPMYGADDGFVYLMNQSAYNVAGNPYTGEFQTPYMDFGFADGSLAGKKKLFDFLEVQYVQTGDWDLLVDYYVDNNFIETLTFPQAQGAVLDHFELDVDRLGNIASARLRKRLRASGNSISFRIYNTGLNQFFKVERLIVNFRVSAEQNKSS